MNEQDHARELERLAVLERSVTHLTELIERNHDRIDVISTKVDEMHDLQVATRARHRLAAGIGYTILGAIGTLFLSILAAPGKIESIIEVLISPTPPK